jgi:hypothetical protein
MSDADKQQRLVDIVSTWIRMVDNDEIGDKNKASLFKAVVKQLVAGEKESYSNDKVHEKDIML